MIQIYNTLTRKKEPFETIESDRVRMYVCGPTVYAKAHIGHAMSSIVFDVIRRYLQYRGFEVNHVMNYTDVDDKVIDRARILGVDPLELADSHAIEYDRHLEDLNILSPTVKPRASNEIQGIIKIVEGLIANGHAYVVDGDVFFEISSDDDYGKLSHRKLDEMRAGARLEIDQRKRHPADFALWKSAKPGEPSWDSSWGPGRPGWHIECSAMSLHHLGQQIDIHGGGNDLIFPHHENEIAQSESLSGLPFSRYWVHNGMMQLGGEAMSKSTGNVLTIDEFLEDYEPDVLRLLVLNSHYRSPLAFSTEVADANARGLDRLRSALKPATGDGIAAAESALSDATKETATEFIVAMDDDFNTPRALASLFDLVRSINQARDSGAGEEVLKDAQARLREWAGVLGLRLADSKPPNLDMGLLTVLAESIRDEMLMAESEQLRQPTATLSQSLENGGADDSTLVDVIVDARSQLRAAGQWDFSDRIRDRLAELGVELEDGKHGTSWRIG